MSGVIVVALIGAGVYASRRASPSTLVTAVVEKRNVTQTVSVVGNVDVADRLNISVETAGEITAIRKRVGDVIVPDETILELNNHDEQLALDRARATLAKAQADLDVRVAGQSNESLAVLTATTTQREAEYKKAQDDLESAKTDLELDRKIQAQLIADAGVNVDLSARSAYAVGSAALNDADAIIGYENPPLNDSFEQSLAGKDRNTLNIANDRYRVAREHRLQSESALSVKSGEELVVAVDRFMSAARELMDAVAKVLEASVPDNALSPTTLATKQTTISTDRSAVITAQITLQSKLQILRSSRTTEQSVVQAAQNLVMSKENAVIVARLAVTTARVSDNAQRVRPRDVDIAALRAVVAQSAVSVAEAQKQLDDRRVRSAIAGTIADIPVKVGQSVSPNQTLVEVLGIGALEVKVNIPEVDIPKVKIGQRAVMTLDAFGSAEEFPGIVVSINPAQTVIEGVPTYTVTLRFDTEDPRIKPGMTVNIEMLTAERTGVLSIPMRAVRTGGEGSRVKVVTAASPAGEFVVVVTGLVGSDGYIEVVSGLKEGDVVAVSGE